MTPIAGRGEVRNPFSGKCPGEFGRGTRRGGKGRIERRERRPPQERKRARSLFFPALYHLETSALVNPRQPVSNALIFSHSPAGQKLTLKLLPTPPPKTEPFREGKEDEMKTRNLDSEGVWR